MNTKVFISLRFSFWGLFFPYCCTVSLVVLLSHGVCSQLFSVGWTWLAGSPQCPQFPWLPVDHSFLSGGGFWRLSGRSKKSVLALSDRQLCTDNNRYVFLFNVEVIRFIFYLQLYVYALAYELLQEFFLRLVVSQVCNMLTLFKSSVPQRQVCLT